MEYRYLGDTGVRVSELCFGTMSFGGDADKKNSLEMYKKTRDRGINFYDCANVYQKGIAEQYLGEFIVGERDKLVITTKAYFPMSDEVNDCGASRKHLFASLHQSLKRLKTDYIDIYYIHRFDENTAIGETMRVLDDMVRSGKILYCGVSNYAAWQIVKSNAYAQEEGLSLFKCLQPMYNLVKRQAEVEILPMAFSEKLAVTPYSPLGGGLLSGKYSTIKKAEEGRLVTNTMYANRYEDERNYRTAQDFTEFAKVVGVSPVSLAIRWVSTHESVTSPIIGARNANQLEDSLNSVNVKMDESMRKKICQLSETPAPATDRTEEISGVTYGAMLKR